MGSMYYELSAPKPDADSDLLSHLYREIGILAVAAALEAMSPPEAQAVVGPAMDHIPALLQPEHLAA